VEKFAASEKQLARNLKLIYALSINLNLNLDCGGVAGLFPFVLPSWNP